MRPIAAPDRAAFRPARTNPYDTVEWEIRRVISGESGETVFEQRDVEVRSRGRSCDQRRGVQVFRGRSARRRRAQRAPVIGRVVDTIGEWGTRKAIRTQEDRASFTDELTISILHRSLLQQPVWFNMGSSRSAVLGCFILSVDDTMIDPRLYRKEGVILRRLGSV